MATKPTESRAEVLGVYLEPTSAQSVRVGSLLRDHAGSVSFIIDDTYIERGPNRPILSLAFHAMAGEEDTIRRLRSRQDKVGTVSTLPPFFSNLLPEGALRSVVEAQLPAGENHEFGMLRRLGADLPGAVVVRSEESTAARGQGAERSRRKNAEAEAGDLVKFSLAGVQMKFSMVQSGDRLTLPAHGEGERVIVKLPAKDYPDLPEIEFSAMMLAQAAGVTIAVPQLAPVERVADLRPEFLRFGKNVLAVPRFDRDGERRIHMEDFAQILGAIGNQKYTKANIETVVRLVARFTPDPAAATLEMVRRIVIDIMLGNGDNHLKNTSFLYADGRTPTLSPAYDIVPTVFFQPNDNLALSFGGKKAFERITQREFDRMASYVGVSAKAITREIANTVERAHSRWPELLRSLPWPKEVPKTLAARWPKLALCNKSPNPFE